MIVMRLLYFNQPGIAVDSIDYYKFKSLTHTNPFIGLRNLNLLIIFNENSFRETLSELSFFRNNKRGELFECSKF